MPLSLSLVGVLLFDIASPGCGVVLLDDDVLPGVMLPLDELLAPEDGGVDDVDDDVLLDGELDELLDGDVDEPADGDDELLVAGLVVDGLIVPVVLLDDGDVLLDDELVDGVDEGEGLLSRWQPATPMAAATARTAQGFGFICDPPEWVKGDDELLRTVSRIGAMPADVAQSRTPCVQPVAW